MDQFSAMRLQTQFGASPPPRSPYSYATAKVAIPRLERSTTDESDPNKQRTKVACETCRKRKVKCTGHRPSCHQCIGSNIQCVYDNIRADRLRDTIALNHELVALLRDVKMNLDESDQRRVDDLLAFAEGAVPKRTRLTQEKGRNASEAEDDSSPVSQWVGSNTSLEVLDEDVFRSRESADTGFVGPQSEVQWLRSIQQRKTGHENTGPESGPSRQNYQTSGLPAPPRPAHASDFTFYLDHESLHLETPVDENVLPHPDIADRLFECYMNTIHTSFPILEEKFEDEFRQFFTAIREHRPFQVPKCWQARANFVFALGARYSHLLNADWQGDVDDHRVYMARGLRLIGLDPTEGWIIHASPSLVLLQATALLSLYYLVIGHASKAWVMIGICLRFALSVGLHLRKEDVNVSNDQKQTLIRSWWSLHSIECLLSTTTGRPCIMPVTDCTVPLPQTPIGGRFTDPSNISGASSTSGELSSSSGPMNQIRRRSFVPSSLLFNRASIDIITHRTISLLYSPTSSLNTWPQTQKVIAGLMQDMDNWAAATFPKGLTSSDLTPSSERQRERLLLAFSMFSARMLVTRPCVLRLERSDPAGFNQKTSDACVEAAQDVSKLLPDPPDAVWVYSHGPWWSIIHNIMQATAVLLLETCRDGASSAAKYPQQISCLAKLVHWLQSMSSTNTLARRACNVIHNILTNADSPSMAEIADLIQRAIVQSQAAQMPMDLYPDPQLWQTQHFHSTDPMDFEGNVGHTGHAGSYYIPPVTGPMPYQDVVLGDLFPGPEFDSFRGPQTAQTYGNTFLTSFDQSASPVTGDNNWGLGADQGYDNVYTQNPDLWNEQQQRN